MKAMIKFTTLASLILASSAHAKTAWVEGPLWKAPQATSVTLKLLGKEKLLRDCAILRKAIYNEDGSSTTLGRNRDTLERYRKLITPVVLDVVLKANAPLELKVMAEDSVDPQSDKLPYFTQKEAITGVLLDEVKDISLSADDKSYTEHYRKMDFADSVVAFSQKNNGDYTIKIDNRDAACDLYEGNGTIVMEAPAYVVLDENSSIRLNEFYNKKLLPELNEVLSAKTELLPFKAARIGYRTGKVLDDEFSGLSTTVSENQIREVMKSLLNTKTLEVSSNVIRSGNQMILNLQTGIQAKNIPVFMEF